MMRELIHKAKNSLKEKQKEKKRRKNHSQSWLFPMTKRDIQLLVLGRNVALIDRARVVAVVDELRGGRKVVGDDRRVGESRCGKKEVGDSEEVRETERRRGWETVAERVVIHEAVRESQQIKVRETIAKGEEQNIHISHHVISFCIEDRLYNITPGKETSINSLVGVLETQPILIRECRRIAPR